MNNNVLTLGVLAMLTMVATGCTVGPDYQRPALAVPAAYIDPASVTAAAPHHAVQHDIQRDWWTLFRSPALDALIEQSFTANPSITEAQAALQVAQENVSAQRGFFFPTVQAGYAPTRTKIAGNLGGNSPGIQGNGSVIQTGEGTPASEGGKGPYNTPVLYNFHTAQLTVGYAPDIFGANRREMESAQAQQRAEGLQLEAAYITLASNIAAAAFQDALLRKQIDVVEHISAANRRAVDLARRQRDAGYTSGQELAAQQNAAAQAAQLLPPLRRQFEQNRDLLRVLAGIAPAGAVPAFTLESFTLPQELPLSLPSQLIEQRPDIRMAEEQLRAATAQAGVARAARLPQFSISATAGGAASQFGQMFWNSGKFFDVTASLVQPLFDGGTLKHRERAAHAALRGAVAAYQGTVARAYQDVADVLHAIDAGGAELQAARDAQDAAESWRALAARQHANGYLDRLALITAEQDARQAQLALTQAQAGQLGAAAALFQALGGGWWHRAKGEGAVDPGPG
jgi:NodT family efflux transporter outer membrane factor (OMF) lipoprotein